MCIHGALKFLRPKFCDTQCITEIHEIIVSWKFGAKQYIAKHTIVFKLKTA